MKEKNKQKRSRVKTDKIHSGINNVKQLNEKRIKSIESQLPKKFKKSLTLDNLFSSNVIIYKKSWNTYRFVFPRKFYALEDYIVKKFSSELGLSNSNQVERYELKSYDISSDILPEKVFYREVYNFMKKYRRFSCSTSEEITPASHGLKMSEIALTDRIYNGYPKNVSSLLHMYEYMLNSDNTPKQYIDNSNKFAAIFYGPAGVGKTFFAKRIFYTYKYYPIFFANSLMGFHFTYVVFIVSLYEKFREFNFDLSFFRPMFIVDEAEIMFAGDYSMGNVETRMLSAALRTLLSGEEQYPFLLNFLFILNLLDNVQYRAIRPGRVDMIIKFTKDTANEYARKMRIFINEQMKFYKIPKRYARQVNFNEFPPSFSTGEISYVFKMWSLYKYTYPIKFWIDYVQKAYIEINKKVKHDPTYPATEKVELGFTNRKTA